MLANGFLPALRDCSCGFRMDSQVSEIGRFWAKSLSYNDMWAEHAQFPNIFLWALWNTLSLLLAQRSCVVFSVAYAPIRTQVDVLVVVVFRSFLTSISYWSLSGEELHTRERVAQKKLFKVLDLYVAPISTQGAHTRVVDQYVWIKLRSNPSLCSPSRTRDSFIPPYLTISPTPIHTSKYIEAM